MTLLLQGWGQIGSWSIFEHLSYVLYLSCCVKCIDTSRFLDELIHLGFYLQPAPAPYDHTVDEQEHTVEQWKGKNSITKPICWVNGVTYNKKYSL